MNANETEKIQKAIDHLLNRLQNEDLTAQQIQAILSVIAVLREDLRQQQ